MEKTYMYGKFEIVVIETEGKFWTQANIPEEIGWGSEYEFTLEDSFAYLIKRVLEDKESGGLTVAVELETVLVSLGLMPANFQIDDTIDMEVDFDKAYDAWEASWIDGPQC